MSRTWRQVIAEALDDAGETWADVEICTWSGAELSRQVRDGVPETPFGMITAERMYYLSEDEHADRLIESVERVGLPGADAGDEPV